MKSIIARMQEMKESPLKIMEDGTDVNKVETALKSANVALRDSVGEFRDLDDVLIDLGGKWDGLSRGTQRYIATVAAGNRMQSRFLALMENHEKTMEFKEMAEDSAGMSTVSFTKYLDSLEAAFNRLKAAVEGFFTSTNFSEFFKNAVNALADLVQGMSDAGFSASVLGITAVFVIGRIVSKFVSASVEYRAAQKSVNDERTKSIQKIREEINATARLNTLQKEAALSRMAETGSEKGSSLAAGASSVFSTVKTGLIGGVKTLLPSLLSIGLSVIGGLFVKWIVKQIGRAEREAREFAEKLDKMSAKSVESERDHKQAEGLVEEYEELVQLEEATGLTADEKERLNSVQKQLADNFPELIKYYSAEGDAIFRSSEEMREYLLLKREEALLNEEELLETRMEGHQEETDAIYEKIKAQEELISTYKIQEGYRTSTAPNPSYVGPYDFNTTQEVMDMTNGLETLYEEFAKENGLLYESMEDFFIDTDESALENQKDFVSLIEEVTERSTDGYKQGLEERNEKLEELIKTANNDRSSIISEKVANSVSQAVLKREREGTELEKSVKMALEMALKSQSEDYLKDNWGEGDIEDIFSDDKDTRQKAVQQMDDLLRVFLRDEADYSTNILTPELASEYVQAMQERDTMSLEEARDILETFAKSSAPKEIIDDIREIFSEALERKSDDKAELSKFLGVDEGQLDEFNHTQLQIIKNKTSNLSIEMREVVFDAYRRAFTLTGSQEAEIQEELESTLMGMDFSNPLSIAQTMGTFQNVLGGSSELTSIFSLFSSSVTDMEMDLDDLNGQMEHYYNTIEKIADLQEDIAKGSLDFESMKFLQSVDPTLQFVSDATGHYKVLNTSAQELIESQKGQNRELLESLKLIYQRAIFQAQLDGDTKRAQGLQRSLELINKELNSMPRDSLAVAFEGIEDVVSSLEQVGSAMTEQVDNGMLSFNTALELIRGGYHDLIEIQDGVATLSMENAKALVHAKEQEAKASIQAEQDMIAATIAGIDAEIAVAKARLEIAEQQQEDGLEGHEGYLKAIDRMNEIGLGHEQAVLEDGVISLELANGEKAKFDSKYFKWLGGAQKNIQEESLRMITERMQGEIEVIEAGIKTWENYHKAQTGDSFQTGIKASSSMAIGGFSDVDAYKDEADKVRAQIQQAFMYMGDTEKSRDYAENVAKRAYEGIIADNKKNLDELLNTRGELDGLYDKLEGMKGFNFEELVMTGGKGASGGSKKETKLKEYQTKLEETYNILRRIQLLQEQIQMVELARELETDGFRIQASIEKQLGLMEREIGYHTQATQLQQKLMGDYRKELLDQYSQFVDFTKGFLEINVGAVKKASAGEMTDEQIEYIKTFEDLVDKYNSAEDAANSYNQSVLSLKKSMEDLRRERIQKVIDMENRLLQALIRRDELELERQKEKLQKMKDADISYLESVRRMREKEKQLRENEKDLEGLSKKRQRLALLERDTSGAYAREIAELKAEIAEEEEALSQDRIDQIIEDLEDETNRRGDELDKQIEDLEKAHEAKLEDMSIYWEEVEAIMQAGTDAMLDTLMEYDGEFKNMSQRQKELWIDDMTTAAQEVEAILQGLISMQEELNAMKPDVSPNKPPTKRPGGGSGSGASKNDGAGVGSVKSFSGQIFSTAQDASRGQGGVRPLYGSGPYTIIGESGSAYRVRYKGLDSGTSGWFPKARAYKDGGLVDYTGPAWVDGSKGKPEAFLSADDTKNFMELARTLKAINNKEISENAGGGNTTIKIDVKVEEGSGLTEDGLIKAVKRDIVNDPVMKTLTTVRRR